jgi:hypothetical protein
VNEEIERGERRIEEICEGKKIEMSHIYRLLRNHGCVWIAQPLTKIH